jgi:hypothetical protein
LLRRDRQQLVTAQLADAERREELAGIQLSLGKTLADLGQADSAIAPLEAARHFYEALAGVSRDKSRFRSQRVAAFEALGRAHSTGPLSSCSPATARSTAVDAGNWSIASVGPATPFPS